MKIFWFGKDSLIKRCHSRLLDILDPLCLIKSNGRAPVILIRLEEGGRSGFLARHYLVGS